MSIYSEFASQDGKADSVGFQGLRPVSGPLFRERDDKKGTSLTLWDQEWKQMPSPVIEDSFNLDGLPHGGAGTNQRNLGQAKPRREPQSPSPLPMPPAFPHPMTGYPAKKT
ncbi:MAG: hypothetical protein WCY11_04605 [Novosphingobium sp.]